MVLLGGEGWPSALASLIASASIRAAQSIWSPERLRLLVIDISEEDTTPE